MSSPKTPATRIDSARLEAARRDARAGRLVAEARAYGSRLKRSGRDHSLPGSGPSR